LARAALVAPPDPLDLPEYQAAVAVMAVLEMLVFKAKLVPQD